MTVGGDAELDELDLEPRDALTLFDRWERQSWTLADVDMAADRDGWEGLPSFLAAELRRNVDRFFLGEVAVAQTLAPLAQCAPEPTWQMYLCTQLADEARHALFFVRYLEAVGARDAGVSLGDDVNERWEATPAHFAELLDRQLRDVTERVWRSGGLACWYRAVTLYHLIVEGVLAVTGQRLMLDLVRDRPGLAALRAGMLNIARDESRHISFGVGALREGVRSGYGDAIAEQLHASVPLAVRIVLAPELAWPQLLPASVRRTMAVDVERRIARAGDALAARVRRMGLDDVAADVRRAWAAAVRAGLDEYRELHGRDHPLRTIEEARA